MNMTLISGNFKFGVVKIRKPDGFTKKDCEDLMSQAILLLPDDLELRDPEIVIELSSNRSDIEAITYWKPRR